MTETKRFSRDEWNKLWEAKELEFIPATRNGFLMIGQMFKGDVKYQGKVWHATAWKIGGDDAFVEMTLEEK